ncbi:protein suppressor of white apricot [Anopheles aquasalis]|uniref:protein suppressor of white apricot n=1 Tax=Anopheles aquasalis TaxID=42839 RepID=UPI00215A8466|nr:protein suppressor of white apricot [Anopheles aquasalis]
MTERWHMNSLVTTKSGLGVGSAEGGGTASGGGSNGVGNHGSSLGNGNTAAGTTDLSTAGSVGGGVIGGAHAFGAANGESGILRKTGHYHHHHHHHGGTQENFDDLLVFGYSCKIFRDNERARYIDQGRHLIPWMGDNQLKIDRYDARGALHDLAPYEPPPGGYRDRLEGLTAAEQKAEQLCEEERYYSLYRNEVEEEIAQEESLKRQLKLGTEIPFDYDAPPQEGATVATVEQRSASGNEQDDDPYVPLANFEIPSDIPLPDTMKEHAIIEKTAKFIASQDAQMEILLKTKQANNPQFDFLNQSGHLFRYYRHVLLAFRTNQYPSSSSTSGSEQPEVGGGDDEEPNSQQNGTATVVTPSVVVPTIKYKPSADCAYTQLISKITGAPIPTVSASEGGEQSPSSGVSTPTGIEKKLPVSTGLAGLVQYDSGSSDDDEDGDDDNDANENSDAQRKRKSNEPKESKARPLSPFQGVVPALTIQHVIDRTAIYVAKNGYSFEEALRAKNDPRFVFLNQTHQYYPYYAYCVRQRMNGGENGTAQTSGSSLPAAAAAPNSPPKVTVRTETGNGTVVETTPSLGIKAVHTAAPKVAPVSSTKIQHQKLGAPVSFMLPRKAKDDTSSKMLGSDDDEDEQQVRTVQPEEGAKESQEQLPEPPKQESKLIETTKRVKEELQPKPPIAILYKEETVEPLPEHVQEEIEKATAVADESQTNSPTTNLEPTVSKEKQAERKKRASMFVNLIKHVDRKPSADEREHVPEARARIIDGGHIASDVEEGSVQSIRSTSLSPKDQKAGSGNTTTTTTTIMTTTVIEDDDDDDDDVVLVSETRPAPVRRSRTRSRSPQSPRKKSIERSSDSRRTKKKKSKSRHRSSRAKSKSKKSKKRKSRSRSRSRGKRERSRTRRDRSKTSRRRGRSSSSTSSSSRSRSRSRKRSQSHTSSRNSHVKRRTDVRRRAHSSSSPSRSRSRSRSAGSASGTKRSRRSERSPVESSKRKGRKDRSRESSRDRKRKKPPKDRSTSRGSHRKSDSDSESRRRRQRHRKNRTVGEGHDERYTAPSRARYWDC